jgi:hypothetical protein
MKERCRRKFHIFYTYSQYESLFYVTNQSWRFTGLYNPGTNKSNKIMQEKFHDFEYGKIIFWFHTFDRFIILILIIMKLHTCTFSNMKEISAKYNKAIPDMNSFFRTYEVSYIWSWTLIISWVFSESFTHTHPLWLQLRHTSLYHNYHIPYLTHQIWVWENISKTVGWGRALKLISQIDFCRINIKPDNRVLIRIV